MREWILTDFLEQYKNILLNGKKVTGRVPDTSKPEKDYSKIAVGDVVVFRAIDHVFAPIPEFPDLKFPVLYNRHYLTVEDMLKTEGLGNVLPEAKSLEEGVEIYHSMPGYKERIKLNGIYAIGLGEKIN